MTIDLKAERLTLPEAAEILGCSASTVWRWALYGIRRQKLPSFVIGARRYVTPDALEHFVSAQNENDPVASSKE